jgi:hypothetical protein
MTTNESSAQEVETIELPPIIPADRLPVCQKEELSDEAIRQVLSYKGMILASPTDKDGYTKILGAHKFGKVVAAKIKSSCLEGRRPALKEQDDWIKFEKQLLGQIEPILVDLDKSRKIFEDAEKIRKEDDQRKARLKVQARLDALSSIGRRADYETATTYTDEQWEAFFAIEKAAWETENAQRAADERQRQISELRKAELSEFGISSSVPYVSNLSEEQYQLILSESKAKFDAQNELKRLDQEEKKAKDSRYRVRVAALMALEVAVGPDDIDTVYSMEDEDWSNYLADETEAYRIRADEKAEDFRLDTNLRDRLQAMAGHIARPITAEESAAIRIMSPDDWGAFLDRIIAAHQEKLRLASEERQKDDALRSRMVMLSSYGTAINTELGTRLREMDEQDWNNFLDHEIEAYNERQAEQVRLQEALAKPAPVVEALPLPIATFPTPDKFEEVNVQHLLEQAPADILPEQPSEDDILKSWLDLLAETVWILPIHSTPAIASRLQATQAGVVDILRSLWHYEKTDRWTILHNGERGITKA